MDSKDSPQNNDLRSYILPDESYMTPTHSAISQSLSFGSPFDLNTLSNLKTPAFLHLPSAEEIEVQVEALARERRSNNTVYFFEDIAQENETEVKSIVKIDTPVAHNVRPIRLDMELKMSTAKKVRELPKPKPPSTVTPRIAAIKASHKRLPEADLKNGPPLKAQKCNKLDAIGGTSKEIQ